MARRTVQINVSNEFFKKMNKEREKKQKEMGVRRISQPALMDMLSKNMFQVKDNLGKSKGKKKNGFCF